MHSEASEQAHNCCLTDKMLCKAFFTKVMMMDPKDTEVT